jgi:hypothetical protein
MKRLGDDVFIAANQTPVAVYNDSRGWSLLPAAIVGGPMLPLPEGLIVGGYLLSADGTPTIELLQDYVMLARRGSAAYALTYDEVLRRATPGVWEREFIPGVLSFGLAGNTEG